MSDPYRPSRLAILVAAAALAISIASPVLAQSTPTQQSTQTSPTPPTPPAQFFETVTVSATLAPATVRDVPGTISVIDAAAIDRALMVNVADLVKFEPGIYIESVLTRVGLNGFNIRGIGGNRVMTQVDGVETSEQFDFGPFNVHQFALDLDVLKSAEIVRSAGSSLYGSDALGGVVSFFTKDPADYLRGRRFHVSGKTMFDGRSGEASGNAVIAAGSGRTQGSLFVSYANGHETHNRGRIDTSDSRRTVLNPQDRTAVQALGKVAFTVSPGNTLLASIEASDTRVDTDALSSRSSAVLDITSRDIMQRQRVSLDHTLQNRFGLQQFSWNAYFQNSDTEQVVDEDRAAAGSTPRLLRSGTLDYSQHTIGAAVQGRKVLLPASHPFLLTVGSAYKQNTFDMLRDRLDLNASTGAVILATNLILPTKYFPESTVSEFGIYGQGEMSLGRLTLRPGVRYDRFALDARDDDAVFLASLSPAPVDFSADAVSARIGATVDVTQSLTLHGQYAGGFRAPSYSAVNSGFTNLQGGYTSMPNPDLRPETSDNFEAGIRIATSRVSLAATAFSNHYDDFILQEARGFNPATGLLEFQYQNVSKVRIEGIELQADARVLPTLRLRASYARIRGNDISGAEDQPLDSVAPDQGVVGLEYSHASGRWGADVSARGVSKPSSSRLSDGAFVPPAYAVGDVSGWISLNRELTLRGAIQNFTNARYFEWSNVRGRTATDATIDRYTSPGVSALLSLAYGW